MEKVVITGPFNHVMKRALEQALGDTFELIYITSRDEYHQLKEADYTILRTLCYTAEDIAKMHKVKLIQRWGAGYDTVDIKSAAEKGIPVAVTFGLNAIPVSEMTLALTLAVYRNLVPQTVGIQTNRWKREAYAKRSYTIHGKTVGLIGMGNIGRRVAALYNAFGAKVLYFDLSRLSSEEELALGITYHDYNSLWELSDIVSLHVPLTEKTNGMVNQDVLNKMKDGAVLINTAREELVDYWALAETLKSGRMLGAGLDAIEESIIGNNPFSNVSNVVLTAHLGGNTVDNAAHMAERCAEQIRAVSRGTTLLPPHAVNSNL